MNSNGVHRDFTGAVVTGVIARLEKKFPIEILFFSDYGSKALELTTVGTSDSDYLVFYKATGAISHDDRKMLNDYPHHEIPQGIHARARSNELDFYLTDIKVFDYYNIDYDIFTNDHPDLLATHLIHHDRFNFDSLPGKNCTKIASLLSDAFYYGNIVTSSAWLYENIEKIRPQLRIYDFCKRRYVSALGRLENYMIEPGKVMMRSYLYSVNELLAAEFALQTRKIPPARFTHILPRCDDMAIMDVLEKYFAINRNSGVLKSELLIDPNPRLNAYIKRKLDEIKPELIELYNLNRDALFEISVPDSSRIYP
ncbi:MAG: nucleotidyltransferase domain-containing protein [Candidatus Accumulibacter sp.]|jgi:hypothetical protein|nr:nucleotidyltransferase domain-containing protein [Accumulibacter sp.]